MTLKILQWNVRSFPANLASIQKAVNDIKPNIICLQETNAKAKNIKIPYFTCVTRSDRDNRMGGGTAIFCKSDVPALEIKLDTVLESTAIKIVQKESAINIVNLYIPPVNSIDPEINLNAS